MSAQNLDHRFEATLDGISAAQPSAHPDADFERVGILPPPRVTPPAVIPPGVIPEAVMPTPGPDTGSNSGPNTGPDTGFSAQIFKTNFDQSLGGAGMACNCAAAHAEDLATQLKEARSASFQAGFDAGRAQAAHEFSTVVDQQRIDALNHLSQQFQTLFGEADLHRQTLEAQVVEFTRSVCEQVFPYLRASQSEERALNQIREMLPRVLNSARISVTVAAPALPLLKPAVAEMARALGISERVELVGDTALASGDVRLKWDSGFMEYSFETVCARILAALRLAQESAPSGVPSGVTSDLAPDLAPDYTPGHTLSPSESPDNV